MMKPAWICAALLAAALVAVAPARLSAEPRPTDAEIGETQRYLTPAEAIDEIFDGVASVDTMKVVLTQGEMESLRASLGGGAAGEEMAVLLPRAADGAALGYAVIVNEKGKYRPITFLVGVGPEVKVRGVEVLVYRESRGGEVRRSRFLRQYRNKSADDPIRTNRDMTNIAGATISVNAMNHGVKRVLLTLELLARRRTRPDGEAR